MPEPHASYVAVCGQRCPSLTRVIRRYVHNPDLTECREDRAEQAVLYAYPWRGRPQASTADGPQSRSDCCHVCCAVSLGFGCSPRVLGAANGRVPDPGIEVTGAAGVNRATRRTSMGGVGPLPPFPAVAQ